MSMELFRKIIDEAATIPQIDCIAFSALGEPLLDRHIVERVAYARKARPDWTPMELYTNGVYLTPEKFDALRDAGLDSLSISLNATNAKQHEAVMGLKGKYETVRQNALYAVNNHRGKVDVIVKAVSNDDTFPEADVVKFHAQWGMRLRPDMLPGNGQVVYEANWGGQTRLIDGRKKELNPNSCCNRAVTQFSILWDGKVSLCCFDPLLKHDLGDLNKQTIREIYNAPWYTQFREDHAGDRAAKYDLCRTCTRV